MSAMKFRQMQMQNPWGTHHLDVSFEQYCEVFVELAVGER
jgi:hypothetical protein